MRGRIGGWAVAAFVGSMLLVGCEGGEPLEPAKPIHPPAGAQILAEDITPQWILGECRTKTGEVNEDAFKYYKHAWVSDRGWEGEVTWKEQDGPNTVFAIKIEDPRVPDQIFVRCEMPGEHPDLHMNGFARVKGRVVQLQYPAQAMQGGLRVYLDNVTLLRGYKTGG